MAANVVMYATRVCPYCIRAEQLLRQRGVMQIEKILVDQDVERKDEMIQKSGGRRTVPQIFIDGHHVGGCDELYALDRSGGLVPLLSH